MMQGKNIAIYESAIIIADSLAITPDTNICRISSIII